MTVYVIDAYGLSAVGELVPANQLKSVLHELTDLVKDAKLRFPAEVSKEACKYLDEHGMGLWAKTVEGHMRRNGSDWEHEGKVLDAVPTLVDYESTDDQTQVHVAKMAVWLNESDEQVVVVTQDVADRPDRMPLASAATELNIEWIDTKGFLDAVISFDCL